jgi:hypothetical protein
MNEEELERLLSSKMKSCVAGRCLPDGFADRMVSEMRRSKRRFRVRAVTAGAVALALISTFAGFWADSPDRGSGETSLVAATHERDTKEKFSCWMLLGFFKECFTRGRTSKRKEED